MIRHPCGDGQSSSQLTSNYELVSMDESQHGDTSFWGNPYKFYDDVGTESQYVL